MSPIQLKIHVNIAFVESSIAIVSVGTLMISKYKDAVHLKEVDKALVICIQCKAL